MSARAYKYALSLVRFASKHASEDVALAFVQDIACILLPAV